MQRSQPRLVQNLLHDIQAAVETKGTLAASPLEQRRLFLRALREDILRRQQLIYRANIRDYDAYSERTPYRSFFVRTPASASSSASSPTASGVAIPLSPAVSPAMPENGAPGHESGPSSVLWHTSADGTSSVTSPLMTNKNAVERPSPHTGFASFVGTSMPATAAAAAAAAAPAGAAAVRANRADTNSHNNSSHNTAAPPQARPTPPTIAVPPRGMDGLPKPSGSAAFTSGGTGLHHRQFSQIKLEKLCAMLDYLLTLPDPLAIPEGCWLSTLPHTTQAHPTHAESGSQPVAAPPSAGPSTCLAQDHGIDGAPEADPSIDVCQIPVPIGLVGILSRYRPRMCVDAVGAGILAGNAMLLDAGSTLHCTNLELMESVHHALSIAALPQSAVVYVETYGGRSEASAEWLQLTERVDLGVVCGPPKLYKFATEVATIPLLKATGHAATLYVDQSALFDMAVEIILNSKFQKHAAANSVTTLIVHQDFPRYAELLAMLAQHGVVLLGDHFARDLAPDAITELVSAEEYNGLSQGLRDLVNTLCVKSVDSLEQALLFLDLFGAKQADGIIASDPRAVESYCRHVDSCAVLVNTSTRLSSGVSLGCGPDLAVATSKIHCRGPITVATLTTTKFLVRSATPGKAALRH